MTVLENFEIFTGGIFANNRKPESHKRVGVIFLYIQNQALEK
jgi:hypothetical protein